MKITKMTLIAALAVGGLLTISSSLLAQESTNTPPASAPPAGGPGGGMRGRGPTLEALTEQLTLTDEQKPKVKTVLDEQRTKMTDLRSETDQDARRTKMQALRDETNTKMKAILTADQYAKWEKMGVNMRSRGQRAGGTNAPAGEQKPQ
jgi:Spy/CpxP family protein refolding chaperone